MFGVRNTPSKVRNLTITTVSKVLPNLTYVGEGVRGKSVGKMPVGGTLYCTAYLGTYLSIRYIGTIGCRYLTNTWAARQLIYLGRYPAAREGTTFPATYLGT